MKDQKSLASKSKQYNYTLIIFFSILFIGIYLTSFYNYLLFHTLAELFSITIAIGIFIIGWNSRKYIRSSFFLIIGISSVYIGIIDLVHTLAYSGMNIFMGYDSNLPTSLWIAARYLQGLSILFAILMIKRRINKSYLMIGYGLVTSLLLLMIFYNLFPICYVEGSGLTPFKIYSEYVIIAILSACILFLFKNKDNFDKRIFKFVLLFISTTIFSEFAFTLYLGVYDFPNLIGHLLKIVAFFFAYRGIIVVGLEDPYNSIFKQLKESEQALRESEFKLRERNKELTSLYNISKIAEQHEKSIEQLFMKTLEFIPPAWQFPDLISTRIIFKEQVFQSKNFIETKWKIQSDIKENEERIGTIEVCYTKEPPFYDRGLFLNEEVDLINAIAEILGRFNEHKEVERRLKQLISTVSHELRTPITVLLMSLDFLKNHKEEIDPNTEIKLMEGIYRNVDLLRNLAEDILIVSRIDEKIIKIDFISFNPLKIVNEILTLMEPIGEKKNISFKVNIDENLRLNGDPKRIDQIFRILIDNALKYSKENSRIEIESMKDYKGLHNPKGDPGILFEFKDNGIGISQEDLPHLFERFFRSDGVSEIPGTGLGLTIARDLIRLHKGEIYVESEFGKGSTFFVFLPYLEGS